MIRKILRLSIGSSSKLIPASMLCCNIVKGSAVDIDDLCVENHGIHSSEFLFHNHDFRLIT